MCEWFLNKMCNWILIDINNFKNVPHRFLISSRNPYKWSQRPHIVYLDTDLNALFNEWILLSEFVVREDQFIQGFPLIFNGK